MAEIAPAERYPVWMLDSLLLTAAALVLGAAVLVAIPVSGYGVLVVHCLGNGLVLGAVWNIYRRERERRWWVWLGAKMFALGLGLVDLVLAGSAVLWWWPQKAALLALIVPAAAGWIAWMLDRARKWSAEEIAAGDEAVLAGAAEEDQSGNAPTRTWTEKAASSAKAIAALGGIVGAIVVVNGFFLVWGGIVWHTAIDGVSYSARDIAAVFAQAVVRHAGMIGAGVAFYVVLLLAVVALILAVDQFVVWRRGDRAPDPAIVARVDPAIVTRADAAVRAVWDFANRPKRRFAFVPLVLVPLLLFLGWLTVVILFDDAESRLALALFEARYGAAYPWYDFFASGGGLPFAAVGAALLLLCLWYGVVRVWPGAEEAAALRRYRRNASDVDDTIAGLRFLLKRQYQGGEEFSPRDWLVGRRRRVGRWLFAVSAVVLPVALGGVFVSLNHYTVLTPDRLLRRDMLAPMQQVPWRDIRSVQISCTRSAKGQPQMAWVVEATDGRRFDLVDGDRLWRRLPGLLKVDAILRRVGARFATAEPVTDAYDRCLVEAGEALHDFRAFLRVMHRD
jgi:hypothetical protein